MKKSDPAVGFRVRGYNVMNHSVVHAIPEDDPERRALCGALAAHGWTRAHEGAATCLRCAERMPTHVPETTASGRGLAYAEVTWEHGSFSDPSSHDGMAYGYFLIVRRVGEYPHKAGLIDSDEGASLVKAINEDGFDAARFGVLLDWLDENAELVIGLSPGEVRQAVACARQVGCFYARKRRAAYFAGGAGGRRRNPDLWPGSTLE